ncbi:MAG: hypothetical protein AB1630_10060 [bacterium]
MKKIILFIALCMTLGGCKKEEIFIPGKIAFLSVDYDRKETLIYIINLNGTNRKELTKISFPISMAASASLDGRKIAFITHPREQKGGSIWIVDTETGSQTRLTDGNSFNIIPRWSPNSKKLAFSSDCDGNFEVYTIDVDGKNLRRLTDNPLNDYVQDWSPDGKKIIFQRKFVKEEKNELTLVDKYGHIIKKIDQGTFTEEYPQLYLINPDGLNIEQLAEGFSKTRAPRWSPDGKNIVFDAEDEKGKLATYIIEVENKRLEKIMDDTKRFYMWSSDGKKVAFVDYNKDGPGISVVNIEDKKIYKIIKGLKGKIWDFPIWTPDEKRIIFALISPNEKNSDIYSLTLDGKLKNLTNTPNISEYSPQWLPIQEIK